jgi:hypothetical protein
LPTAKPLPAITVCVATSAPSAVASAAAAAAAIAFHGGERDLALRTAVALDIELLLDRADRCEHGLFKRRALGMRNQELHADVESAEDVDALRIVEKALVHQHVDVLRGTSDRLTRCRKQRERLFITPGATESVGWKRFFFFCDASDGYKTSERITPCSLRSKALSV